MEKIISSANVKIKHNMVFTARELVELALTSIMDGTREGNIKQFYELSKMMMKSYLRMMMLKHHFVG